MVTVTFDSIIPLIDDLHPIVADVIMPFFSPYAVYTRYTMM